jgi:aminomethyltransferase
MTETHGGEPKKTPLYDAHIRAGARMIDFGGWIMPVYYRGIVEEHKKVRQDVGLFDLCHMGEVKVSGPRALEFLQKVTTNDVSTLVVGQAQYTLLCYPDGGIVDDILVCKTEDGYYLVLNASNATKDIEWLRSHAGDGVEIKDESSETALLAIQGPNSAALLAQLTDVDLDKVYYYQFTSGRVADVDCLISRTGYTGEDGFELFFYHTHAEKLWDTLLDAGSKYGIEPIGLGARDTLRLEMGYSLYGNELRHLHLPLGYTSSYMTQEGRILDLPRSFVGTIQYNDEPGQLHLSQAKKHFVFELPNPVTSQGSHSSAHRARARNRLCGLVCSFRKSVAYSY